MELNQMDQNFIKSIRIILGLLIFLSHVFWRKFRVPRSNLRYLTPSISFKKIHFTIQKGNFD